MCIIIVTADNFEAVKLIKFLKAFSEANELKRQKRCVHQFSNIHRCLMRTPQNNGFKAYLIIFVQRNNFLGTLFDIMLVYSRHIGIAQNKSTGCSIWKGCQPLEYCSSLFISKLQMQNALLRLFNLVHFIQAKKISKNLNSCFKSIKFQFITLLSKLIYK